MQRADHRGGDRRAGAASWSRAATSARSSGRTPRSRSTSPPTRPPAPCAGPPRRAGATSRRPASRCWRATRSTPAGPSSPLVLADGAVHVDTTDLTLDEVDRDHRRHGRERPGRREHAVTDLRDRTELPGQRRQVPDPVPAARAARRRPGSIIRRRFGVTVHGAENVPGTGPVILASNHVGRRRRAAARDLQPAPGARAHQAGDVRRPAGPVPAPVRADPARPVQRRPGAPSRPASGCCATGERWASSPRAPAGPASSTGSTGARPTSAWSPAPRSCRSSSSAPASRATAAARCRRRAVTSSWSTARRSTFDAVPWPRTKQAVEEASRTLREFMVEHLDARQGADRPDAARPHPRGQGQGVRRPGHEHPRQ